MRAGRFEIRVTVDEEAEVREGAARYATTVSGFLRMAVKPKFSLLNCASG
jgi:hypothetical protein